MVERRSPKPEVAGSIPVAPANLYKTRYNDMLNKLKPFKFFDQVKQEAKKVVWPEKKELIASASIVVVAVLLFSLASLILDYGIHNLVRFLLNIGK